MPEIITFTDYDNTWWEKRITINGVNNKLYDRKNIRKIIEDKFGTIDFTSANRGNSFYHELANIAEKINYPFPLLLEEVFFSNFSPDKLDRNITNELSPNNFVLTFAEPDIQIIQREKLRLCLIPEREILMVDDIEHKLPVIYKIVKQMSTKVSEIIFLDDSMEKCDTNNALISHYEDKLQIPIQSIKVTHNNPYGGPLLENYN